MVKKNLLLEKVKPSKVELVDNNKYRFEFKTLNDETYVVFISKETIESEKWTLDDTYDVTRIDLYRDSITEHFFMNSRIKEMLKYQGVYSTLSIEPNHIDPAKFNLLS